MCQRWYQANKNTHTSDKHIEHKESDQKIRKIFSQGKRGRHGLSGWGVQGRIGLLRHRKSVLKKKERRCYWEHWNHLINQEREAELSPADVQSKLEQLWVLHGGPNPLVAPPGAWKPGGESPFVRPKATLTRFHCDKEWEGCFRGAEKQPTRSANKMPIHLPSFTLIPPTVSFSFLRLLRHKTTNSEREWKH